MGFQQDKELVEFLYIEADVPEFIASRGSRPGLRSRDDRLRSGLKICWR
jgi:hypothetical protein